MRKKILFMMLLYVLSVIFAGCGKQETESLESIEKEEIKQIMEDDVLQDGDISETKNIPEYDDVTSEDNDIVEDGIEIDDMTDTSVSEQNIISNDSEIVILNFLQDGTFWTKETDGMGEEYIIHADIHGNIMAREMYNIFGVWIEYGINDNRIVGEKDNDYYVFDTETKEDISDKYVKDYDYIDNVFKTDYGVVFLIKKEVESFEEEYQCFKLVDNNENILFEVSLDKETLLNDYGIEKDENVIETGYCSNNIYYIAYVGDGGDSDALDSLIIDLNRNKIIPAPFPQYNGLYYSSDGDYTIVSSPHHGGIVVNNDTGEVMDLNLPVGYEPCGELFNHKFFAEDSSGKIMLDVQGNVVMDLGDYERPVSYMFGFVDDTVIVEFKGGYSAFTDSKGEFLFEPIKGFVYGCYDKINTVIIADEYGREMFSIDKDGKKEMLALPGGEKVFYVEYEGKNYWVEGGEGGIHAVEMK